MHAEDIGALTRAARGDFDAFDAVVRQHQDRIYNFLYRLTGNGADAEDLAQDTFLKAFKALPRFAGGAEKLPSWLFAIAANAARSRGRHQAVVRRVTPVSRDSGGPEGDGLDFPSTEDSPVEALTRREETRQLTQWVADLDPDLKEALLLREIEGLDYARIAETLEIPIGTVKTRIHRARILLRERYEKSGKRENPPGPGASTRLGTAPGGIQESGVRSQKNAEGKGH